MSAVLDGIVARPVDWDSAVAAHPWLAALAETPQDPEHHAEGDVLVHTRLALAELAALPGFVALSAAEQTLTFWAVLLHDVCKPHTTRVEDNGRITARGHSRRGAIWVRNFLWERGLPFGEREQIAALIRHHQQPFFLVDKPDAEQRLAALSLELRCDLLALVAEADARGRQARDRQRMIDNVELFRQLADERGCLRSPQTFVSPRARYRWLNVPGAARDYDPHVVQPFTVTLMSGLPGAGKDTWVRSHRAHVPVVSLDDKRRELAIDPDENQGAVLDAARATAREHLRKKQPFVWNATNLSAELRRGLIELFVDYGADVEIVYVESAYEAQRAQNREREARVPENVLARMRDRWELPTPAEAHAVHYYAMGTPSGDPTI